MRPSHCRLSLDYHWPLDDNSFLPLFSLLLHLSEKIKRTIKYRKAPPPIATFCLAWRRPPSGLVFDFGQFHMTVFLLGTKTAPLFVSLPTVLWLHIFLPWPRCLSPLSKEYQSATIIFDSSRAVGVYSESASDPVAFLSNRTIFSGSG